MNVFSIFDGILSPLADPTVTYGSGCRQDTGEIWDELKGTVALVKQVRGVSDMISEHEGVNAVARESLGLIGLLFERALKNDEPKIVGLTWITYHRTTLRGKVRKLDRLT